MSTLPPGVFLLTRYYDAHRQLETGQTYYEDGRVETRYGDERAITCRLSPKQVEEVRLAIRASGLLAAKDLGAAGAHDTAAYTISWRLGGKSGSVANAAYPAKKHPAHEKLEARLDEIERRAGCGEEED